MYYVELTRLSSTHRNLRTDSVVGYCREMPKKGARFLLTGEGLSHPTLTRVVETTPVQAIVPRLDGVLDFFTENSRYHLRVIPDAPQPPEAA